MVNDIRIIGIVKHKDGSTEDDISFGESFDGTIFKTLQGNCYLYREYYDKCDNIFKNSFYMFKRFYQFYKLDYESYNWEEAAHIVDNITIVNN